jgi:hypothetical protein
MVVPPTDRISVRTTTALACEFIERGLEVRRTD